MKVSFSPLILFRQKEELSRKIRDPDREVDAKKQISFRLTGLSAIFTAQSVILCNNISTVGPTSMFMQI